MVILKRLRAATLIETLTASVLIVVVFMVASMILNTIFSGTVKRDNSGIKARIAELKYLTSHDKIKIPYAEDFGIWEIEIVTEKEVAKMYYTNGEVTKEVLFN